MSEKKYITGIRCFPKHERAPDFVLGGGVLTIDELTEFVNSNPEILTQYNGKKQLRFQVLKGQNGVLQFVVDQYKKQ
jgi:hypothetical protein